MFQLIPLLGVAWLVKKVYDAVTDPVSDSSGSSTNYDDSARQKQLALARAERIKARSKAVEKQITEQRKRMYTKLKTDIRAICDGNVSTKLADHHLVIKLLTVKRSETILSSIMECFDGLELINAANSELEFSLPSITETTLVIIKNAENNFGSECAIDFNEQYVEADDPFFAALEKIR
jgi:hypothetical protein